MTRPFETVQHAATPAPARFRRFANPDVVCEGWYVVASTRRLRPGSVARAWIGKRDIVVYRDKKGILRAVDRRCAHLGADLARGTVIDKGLQCAFHNWCWGPDGRCTAGPGATTAARIDAYEVRERWGLVWVWAGSSAAYDLPQPDPENRAYVLRLPEQRIACHGHVVLGNGLDLTHVVPVHRFRFVEDPVVDPDPPHRLSVNVHTRFEPTVMRRILGVAAQPARWRFTNIGPSLAWVSVASPTPFELVWAARPLPDGSCATRTLFFLPRASALLRALPMMVATTWADRRVLEGLQFHAGFVPSDAVFAAYARLVEALPEWSPGG